MVIVLDDTTTMAEHASQYKMFADYLCMQDNSSQPRHFAPGLWKLCILYGISEALLHRLQVLQNSAARLIIGIRRREHISPVLFALHWLPIRQCIKFKLLVLVYRCLHQLAPAYLSDLITPYTTARSPAIGR